MLLYDSFTIALRYSVKIAFSQFARVERLQKIIVKENADSAAVAII